MSNIHSEDSPASSSTSVNEDYNNTLKPLDKNGTSDDDLEPVAFGGDLEKGAVPLTPNEGASSSSLIRAESRAQIESSLSRRITGADKIFAEANNTDEPLPPMGDGRPYPPPVPDREQYVVTYDGPKDPFHPHNWPLSRKLKNSFFLGYSAFIVILGSSMFAEGNSEIQKLYHIGPTVATLGTSLFVLGFASGPIIWGPFSEMKGRRITMVISSFGYMVFSFAVATGKDIQTIMICRFFAGFLGAAPIVVTPAVMADLFGAKTRGQAVSVFVMILFGGPMIAPILGGFTSKNSSLGWRWIDYFCGIFGSVAFIMVTLFLEETQHQVLLVQKAETLRRRTGNWGIVAAHEEVTLSFKEMLEKNISRPIVMLFTEPILLLITIYNAFIYGLLYLFLTAIPMIFIGRYHFSQGVGELPYISMLIGVFIGGGTCVLFEKRYNQKMDENNGIPVPEERLPPMMIGSFAFTIGLFWLGWTGDYPKSIPWIVPTIGSSFLGIGLLTIFLPCMNYIIDCYLFYAASAISANTFLRSAFAAAFPLFARPMFLNLTIKWGCTLLGCLAFIMIPVPFLFYRFGKAIRKRSKYSVDLELTTEIPSGH